MGTGMIRRLILVWLCGAWLPSVMAQEPGEFHFRCESQGLQLQVLGSGGPDLRTIRAASSYLIWVDGKARVLVDIGGGAARRFGQSGAKVFDLDAILLTQLYADHTSDLPMLVDTSRTENRDRPLRVYGPLGDRLMPSTVTFVRELFDTRRGVYRYLGEVISPLAKNSYRLLPQDVRNRPQNMSRRWRSKADVIKVYADSRIAISAVYLDHGIAPALAWRVDAGEQNIVISGDAANDDDKLELLAQGVHLLVVPYAITDDANDDERRRFMTPAAIGRVAAQTRARHLVLGHRTARTLEIEDAALDSIKKYFSGEVTFANDLDCFTS
jgi:ribonuclease BN (tRNA processing enzyme)